MALRPDRPKRRQPEWERLSTSTGNRCAVMSTSRRQKSNRFEVLRSKLPPIAGKRPAEAVNLWSGMFLVLNLAEWMPGKARAQHRARLAVPTLRPPDAGEWSWGRTCKANAGPSPTRRGRLRDDSAREGRCGCPTGGPARQCPIPEPRPPRPPARRGPPGARPEQHHSVRPRHSPPRLTGRLGTRAMHARALQRPAAAAIESFSCARSSRASQAPTAP